MSIAKLERDWELVGDLKVKHFEKNFRYPFPKDYFEFLATQNGGRLRPRHYFMINRWGSLVQESIRVLYGIGAGSSSCDIHDKFETFHTHERRMPEWLLPIGGDGSNQICLILNKEKFGEVIFWEMEGEIEFDVDTGQWTKDPLSNCHPVAKSFTEFVNKLTTEIEQG